MEDLFEPIQRGFEDITKGATVAEEKRLKRAQKEQAAAELKLKATKQMREEASQQQLAEYVGSGRARDVQDPKLAALLVNSGKGIEPAMRPKVDMNTLANFKLQLMKNFMDPVNGLANGGDADAALIQQDVSRKLLGLPTLAEEKAKQAQATYENIKRKIPKDALPVLNKTFIDLKENVVAPFYKQQGLSDEQINGMFQNGMDSYLSTFANTAQNPLEAITKTDAPTLKALDEKFKDRITQYNRYGSMSSKDLKGQNPEHMDAMEKDIWMQSTILRGMADVTEKLTGKTTGNIFGDPSQFEMPSQTLEKRLKTRIDERKRGVPPSSLRDTAPQTGGQVKVGDQVGPPANFQPSTKPMDVKPPNLGVFAPR